MSAIQRQARPDIPLGYTPDAHGNELTYKGRDGYWYECTRDAHGEELTFKNSDGSWYEYTRDKHGKELTYKNRDGYWYEYARDAHGKELTFKNSDGYWYEYTRDAHGEELTFKNSDGNWIALAAADTYVLRFDPSTAQYWAGCFKGTRDEALERWNTERTDERGVLFRAALVMNPTKGTDL